MIFLKQPSDYLKLIVLLSTNYILVKSSKKDNFLADLMEAESRIVVTKG
jgi:hypothetical protein